LVAVERDPATNRRAYVTVPQLNPAPIPPTERLRVDPANSIEIAAKRARGHRTGWIGAAVVRIPCMSMGRVDS
jgi:hypothetical protein